MTAALLTAALLTAVTPQIMAQPLPRPGAAPQDGDGLDLLGLQPRWSYSQWMNALGWEDLRPFSSSASRFRIEDGALRLESREDSFLIGRTLSSGERRSIAEFPYLRFGVRIAEAPRGAMLEGEKRDDSAFRIYATFSDDPPRALVYLWSWSLPVGSWSRRGRTIWGDFRGIHRKAFGQGEPFPDRWLLVEVNLRRDFQSRFPGKPLPSLAGVALKTDSNHTPGGRSLAWLRSATLHRFSLHQQGLAEGARVNHSVLWYR